MARYELWYSDDLGNRLAYIDDVIAFDYVSVLGGVGSLLVTIPSRGQIYDTTTRDRRIVIYRQPLNGVMGLEFVGLVRDSEYITSQQGQYQRTIIAFDLNEILTRRITAYYAQSAQVTRTGAADDMMKDIVTDNFISNADYSGTPSPSRSLTAVGLTVQSDLTAGPSLSKDFAWRNILPLLQDLQADSKEQGTETFFGIVPTSETTMQFQTWTARADRTTSTGTNPLVFSLEWGNLSSPKLATNTSAEVNFAYAAGKGERAERIVQTAYNSTAVTASALNRREGLAYSNAETTAAALTDARAAVERNRPTENFSGDIIDTVLTPYGGLSGWNLGDKVTVNYAGSQFDVIIRAVHIQVEGNGNETISARVEA